MNWVDFADALWLTGALTAGGFLLYGAWLCAGKQPRAAAPRSDEARRLDGLPVAAARKG